MTRLRRHIEPGSVQHLISRFVNGEWRMNSPAARTEYLARLSRALAPGDWNPLSFALMSTHIHHGMRAGHAPGASIIQPVHSGFSGWLNRTQHRLGPVFAGRFKNIGFEGEYLGVLLAYIHNNPVRAGVVGDPADTDWTSHRAYIGDVVAPPWLDVELGLSLCGYSSSPSGRLSFHDFVRSLAANGRDPFFSGADVERSSGDIRKAIGGPAELGSVHVLGPETYALPLRTCPEATYVGRWPGTASRLLEVVASATGVPVPLMKSRARRRDIVESRRLAVLVWCRYLGRPQKEICAVLSISPGAGSQLLRADAATERLRPLATTVATHCIEVAGAHGAPLDCAKHPRAPLALPPAGDLRWVAPR